MSLFTGSGVAIVTPFDEEGIDYPKLKTLIQWHLQNKTDAIIVCGTTGEASTMSLEEKKEVIAFTVNEVNKRVPVIAGAGGNNTKDVIDLSKYIEAVSGDGLLLVTPYYNRATQKGLIEHFLAVADAVSIPIILYNVPARTGVNMLPETVHALSKHPNIVGIKEASGDIGQVANIAHLTGENFAIYSGNDDMIVPILSLGGKGVISVLANLYPKETHEMCAYYLDGEVEKARKLQLDLLPIIDALFIENNPIPIKTAMNLVGLPVGRLRLPLSSMEEANERRLRETLVQAGFKLEEEA